MIKVNCVFCGTRVEEVNDCGVCESCWCPEGEVQWVMSKETKQDMKEVMPR